LCFLFAAARGYSLSERAVIHSESQEGSMRPNPIATPVDGETDMFRNRLDNMVDV
jgi:hypothetical protein